MTNKHVWRPGASHVAPSLESEEGGRGSLQEEEGRGSLQGEAEAKPVVKKKSSLPRRRTPTVYIPPKGITDTSTPSPLADGYKTIEKTKRPIPSLLELSRKPYEKKKTPESNWFCGWSDFECLDQQQGGMKQTITEGGRLQTPRDGYRSSLLSRASSSRYNSSHGVRKAHTYTFHHFERFEEYAEHYRDFYAFTTLNSGGSREDEERVYCEGEEVEQDAEVLLPLGVKSLYRGDPYLRELVNRLGIRDPPDYEAQQQQLLGTPRPTPPSIVKRRKDGKDTVNIIVANSAPKR
jgi:hypothetical protein